MLEIEAGHACAVVQLGADGASAEVTSTFSEDEQLVYGVSWMHDAGGVLATASFYDRRLRLWQLSACES